MGGECGRVAALGCMQTKALSSPLAEADPKRLHAGLKAGFDPQTVFPRGTLAQEAERETRPLYANFQDRHWPSSLMFLVSGRAPWRLARWPH